MVLNLLLCFNLLLLLCCVPSVFRENLYIRGGFSVKFLLHSHQFGGSATLAGVLLLLRVLLLEIAQLLLS